MCVYVCVYICVCACVCVCVCPRIKLLLIKILSSKTNFLVFVLLGSKESRLFQLIALPKLFYPTRLYLIFYLTVWLASSGWSFLFRKPNCLRVLISPFTPYDLVHWQYVLLQPLVHSSQNEKSHKNESGAKSTWRNSSNPQSPFFVQIENCAKNLALAN